VNVTKPQRAPTRALVFAGLEKVLVVRDGKAAEKW
jgi:hypothetical protein